MARLQCLPEAFILMRVLDGNHIGAAQSKRVNGCMKPPVVIISCPRVAMKVVGHGVNEARGRMAARK